MSHGTLDLAVDGSFTYIHDGSETTSDSFTYRANDGTVDSVEATVTIAVTALNDPPVAVDDSYDVAEGGILTRDAAVGVLANDTDAEGATLTARLVANVSHGVLTLSPDGSFNYVHDGSETTSDSFKYVANDGSFDSNTATVTITVAGDNDAPVAVDDAYTVAEGGTLDTTADTGVLLNDSDDDGDTLTASLVADVAHGDLTLNKDGSFTYVHDGSEAHSDEFTYSANDGTSDSGNVGTVTITVTPVNDPPVAVDDSIAVEEGGSVTVSAQGSVLANDTDEEGDALGAVLVDDVSHGNLSLNSDGSYTYTHDGGESAADSFTYKANDGRVDSGNVATVTITVNRVNDVPVATDDAYTVGEGRTLTVGAGSGVLANDTDEDRDALKAVLVTNVSHGQLDLADDGSFTYTHGGGPEPSDSFTYMANDGQADSGEATVTITVTGANDAPVAVDDAFTVVEGGTITVGAGTGVLV